jgi:hypothetical protein
MSSDHQNRFSARDLWILIVALFIVALAPSFQSFWIDEGTMGLISRVPTFAEFQDVVVKMKGSEALMPLATTYFWAVEKIVGENEWALRCCNLPWLWLGIVCMALIGKRIAWPWLPLFFAIHPVVWFYADEVRPYAIQLGTGCWLTLGFVQLLQSEGTQTRGFWNFGLAAAATIAASFLGIFVVAAAGLILLIRAVIAHWRLTLRQYAVLGLLGVLNFGITFSIFLKMHAGAGGSKAWIVGFSNMGFASYELLGFIGLGPGRELIRTSAVIGGVDAASHLLIPSFFKLGLLVVIYGTLIYAVFRVSRQASKIPAFEMALLSGTVALLSVLCLFGAALESRFPFWGRHLAPTLPFLLLAIGGLAASLDSIWTKRQSSFLLITLFAVFIYSSAVIRWSPTHAKDDYRTASALAREALSHGKRVSWIGATQPAVYYNVPLSTTWPPYPGTASVRLPSPATDGQPDVIIVTKPDLFDRQGFLPHWIETPGVTVTAPCQSFVVYQFP